MNYYNPNFYQNYPYGNLQQTQQPVYQQAPILNGKPVDGAEMVKAAEVPIGGYGVFPKADLSEVYVKTWNNNGTTSILTYQPTAPIEEKPLDIQALTERIDALEKKLEELSAAPASAKKKEMSAYDY